MLPPQCRCTRRVRSEGGGLPRHRPRPPPPPAPRQALCSETDPLLLLPPNQEYRGRGDALAALGAKALLLLPAAAAETMWAQAAEELRMVAGDPGRVAANRREERSGLSRCPTRVGRERKGGRNQRHRVEGRCPTSESFDPRLPRTCSIFEPGSYPTGLQR